MKRPATVSPRKHEQLLRAYTFACLALGEFVRREERAAAVSFVTPGSRDWLRDWEREDPEGFHLTQRANVGLNRKSPKRPPR